nr:IQ and AAA domain-containing protein 1 [Halyomorpha halys]
MSNQTYNLVWSEAVQLLDEATRLDVEAESAKPTKDKELARRAVGRLYLMYLLAVNKLDLCYDQIVQPQKRRLLKRMLECALGRCLELKHELVSIDLSEFSYLDDLVQEMGLTIQDTEIKPLRLIRREREAEIKERRATIDRIMRDLGFFEVDTTGIIMTEDRAVRLIQSHERARQGRLRAGFMKEIRLLKEKVKTEPKEEADLEEEGRQAALKIQTIWRGYITRRKIRRRVVEEMLLIGMLPSSHIVTEEQEKALEVQEYRRGVQRNREEEYQEALIREREEIKKDKGPVMMEEMADQIRSWLMGFKQSTGKFPDLPSEEAGGSALVLKGQAGQAESDRSKSTAPSSRGSKGKAKKGKEDDIKKNQEEEDPGFRMSPSNFLTLLMVSCSEYDEIWRPLDESTNPRQHYYIDMVRREKTAEVESELRKIVDDQLRAELEALQAALDRDKSRKSKKGKKAGKKGRRGGKKSKKKKEKDLTPDRTTESLFEELVTNGIIRKYPEVYMSTFIGERACANLTLRQDGKDPQPGLGDIRQIMMEYVVLPLGMDRVRRGTPLIRSLLIAGPSQCGKKHLVHACCTELGATLFDLSPANIVGKYPGKSGLIMLLHLVSKVSRLLQPSIIFIEGAEKTFMKKVAKTDKTDPKRLKKDLAKLVKSIGPEDQVMLIGTTKLPWEADQKLLAQSYQKMVYIPRTDYGSLSRLWADQLFQYSDLNRQFNTSSLARLSDGFTVGAILSAIKDVFTCKRILQLRLQQLTHAELVAVLCKKEPIYREEEEEFLNWLSKTPLGRRRQKAVELAIERAKEAEAMGKAVP